MVKYPKDGNATTLLKKCRALTNGTSQRTYKIRAGSCRFVNKKSLVHAKKPLYEQTPIPDVQFDSAFTILKYPIRSEKINRLIETNNTVVFIVTRESTKPEITKAFKTVFGCQPVKVNTLITPLGDKKAFIKLPKDVRAEDIAAGFTPK